MMNENVRDMFKDCVGRSNMLNEWLDADVRRKALAMLDKSQILISARVRTWAYGSSEEYVTNVDLEHEGYLETIGGRDLLSENACHYEFTYKMWELPHEEEVPMVDKMRVTYNNGEDNSRIVIEFTYLFATPDVDTDFAMYVNDFKTARAKFWSSTRDFFEADTHRIYASGTTYTEDTVEKKPGWFEESRNFDENVCVKVGTDYVWMADPTASPWYSQYVEGYDIRALTFRYSVKAKGSCQMWMVDTKKTRLTNSGVDVTPRVIHIILDSLNEVRIIDTTKEVVPKGYRINKRKIDADVKQILDAIEFANRDFASMRKGQ